MLTILKTIQESINILFNGIDAFSLFLLNKEYTLTDMKTLFNEDFYHFFHKNKTVLNQNIFFERFFETFEILSSFFRTK